jgi:mono/diheme cytochrome c family protein
LLARLIKRGKVASCWVRIDLSSRLCRAGRRDFDSVARHIRVWARGEGQPLRDMMKRMWRGRLLAALGVVALLTSVPARAQNLDEGKSGARLFGDSCAACHRSARGLTKGRFRLTLYLFLQDHYVSNSSSAWELASYLTSVDDMPRGRPRSAPKAPPASTSRTSPRPPMPVPQR